MPEVRGRTFLAGALAGAVAIGALGLGANALFLDGGALDGGTADGGASADARRVDPVEVAGTRFLDTYLDGEGRVVRHDQGGDSVSEGQAYAMLITQALGDEERFDLAWRWTEQHLKRDDGLLSWHWKDGEIVDPMPAADADVDAAVALVLAGERFAEPSYRDAGLALAEAVLTEETVMVGTERVLVAGPWATASKPYKVNPSYLSPGALSILGAESGDPRWDEVARSSRRLLDSLLSDPAALPPDWAQVQDDGNVSPTNTPGFGDARYGLDAARLFVRLAGEQDGQWADLAREATPILERAPEPTRLALALDGNPLSEDSHPLMLVAAAGAASIDGDPSRRDALLDEAEALETDTPTYYGSAWVALGRLLLTPGGRNLT